MVTTDQNIYREAKELLDRKAGITWDEFQLFSLAVTPLTLLRASSEILLSKGLETIARKVEEGNRKEAMLRRRDKGIIHSQK
ncbi:unnamed protein product [marine sediment metagenome]|uniref:Uncharacterized protein n=1 Tax=marine sediment metagenome TaxID=412755 RepID=X1TB60_9ZZZZ